MANSSNDKEWENQKYMFMKLAITDSYYNNIISSEAAYVTK